MQRRLRVWGCEFPPRQACGDASSNSTLAPASRAISAAHSAALPPPITNTSIKVAPCCLGPTLGLALPSRKAGGRWQHRVGRPVRPRPRPSTGQGHPLRPPPRGCTLARAKAASTTVRRSCGALGSTSGNSARLAGRARGLAAFRPVRCANDVEALVEQRLDAPAPRRVGTEQDRQIDLPRIEHLRQVAGEAFDEAQPHVGVAFVHRDHQRQPHHAPRTGGRPTADMARQPEIFSRSMLVHLRATADAVVDVLGGVSEGQVSRVDRSLAEKTATGCNGSAAPVRDFRMQSFGRDLLRASVGTGERPLSPHLICPTLRRRSASFKGGPVTRSENRRRLLWVVGCRPGKAGERPVTTKLPTFATFPATFTS